MDLRKKTNNARGIAEKSTSFAQESRTMTLVRVLKVFQAVRRRTRVILDAYFRPLVHEYISQG